MVHAAHVEEAVLASGEHLVGIALVRDVEDDLVLRGIEHIVQGYGSLGEAQVRSHVASVMAYAVEHALADLIGYYAELVYGERF